MVTQSAVAYTPMADCIAAGGTWVWTFVGGITVGECLLRMGIGRGTGG